MARLGILLAALFAVPVHAASFASASLSDFRVTLFDLNQSDGIAPAITFASGITAVVFAEDGPLRQRVSGPINSDLAVTVGRSSASIAGTRMNASGSSLGTLVPDRSASYFALADIPAGDFTLTANTRASFSAFSQVSARTTGSFGLEDAFAFTYIAVWGPERSGYNDSSMSVGVAPCDPPNFCPGESLSNSGLLAASFANLTGSGVGGQFARQVAVFGGSAVPAIPEPETYAMMVAGLGLLGFMLRRRGARLPRSAA